MTDAELDELDKKIDKRKEEMKKTYNKFWEEFGKSIKAAIVEDVSNRKALAEIARFYSSHDTKEYTSLGEYVERMKEGQEEIYYMGGENREMMLETPVVKGLVRKGYEVLLLDDPIDEYTVHTLDKFDDKQMTNIGKSGFKMPTDEDEEKTLKKL